MNPDLIKSIILEVYNSGTQKEELLKRLGETEDALIAASWIWPEQYLDGDLVKRVSKITPEITTEHQINLAVIRAIIEAFRGPQYQSFIRHLVHSFCEEEVFPVRMKGIGGSCCICGKPLLYWREWRETCKTMPDSMMESKTRSHLAIGSRATSVCMCTNCLIQLRAFQSLMDALDPGILNFRKSTPGGLKA